MKKYFIETHKNWIELLNILNKKAKYFYVVKSCVDNDDHDDFLLNYCNNNLILKKFEETDNAFSVVGLKVPQYEFEIESGNMHHKFFEFLKEFETPFCRQCLSNKTYKYRSDFGLDDIAFLDEQHNFLCTTITHEAECYASQDIINVLNNKEGG